MIRVHGCGAILDHSEYFPPEPDRGDAEQYWTIVDIDLRPIASDIGLPGLMHCLYDYLSSVLEEYREVVREGRISPPGAWIESYQSGGKSYFRMRWRTGQGRFNNKHSEFLGSSTAQVQVFQESVERRRRLQEIDRKLGALLKALDTINRANIAPQAQEAEHKPGFVEEVIQGLAQNGVQIRGGEWIGRGINPYSSP